MYTHIYQNSYVVAVICFILLCAIFYFLQIGYSTSTVNGKVVKKFSWKYPLAISLVIWVIWHFYLYPPADVNGTSETSTDKVYIPKTNKVMEQKFDMRNWN